MITSISYIYNDILSQTYEAYELVSRCFVYFFFFFQFNHDFAKRFDEILFSTMRSSLQMQNLPYPTSCTQSFSGLRLFARIQKLGEISSYKKYIYIYLSLSWWQTWRVATFVATVYNGDVIISIPRTTCRKAARNVHAMPVYTRVISAGRHRYGIHKPQGESYALSE